MWTENMARAYSAGLADAKRGNVPCPDNYEFRACYLKGYSHG